MSGKSTITPYIHILYSMCQNFQKFKKLNLYNLKGLEKLNDFTTQYFHNSTNKHRSQNSYLEQLIQKRFELNFYFKWKSK